MPRLDKSAYQWTIVWRRASLNDDGDGIRRRFPGETAFPPMGLDPRLCRYPKMTPKSAMTDWSRSSQRFQRYDYDGSRGNFYGTVISFQIVTNIILHTNKTAMSLASACKLLSDSPDP